MDRFSRTELLIGKDNLIKLNEAKVAIFGIGGVGSYVTESLARAGIGKFILIDKDKVSISNINRQLIATTKTVGEYKVDLMKERIMNINPNADVQVFKTFYMPDCKENILDNSVDYIVDAIDTVTAKIFLIEEAKRLKIPIICSMGTGNKLNPQLFEITDINKTSVCPLAKVIRKELKKRNINNVKVLYSKEEPIKIHNESKEEIPNGKNTIPGSISFVPSIAGLLISGEVVKDIIRKN